MHQEQGRIVFGFSQLKKEFRNMIKYLLSLLVCACVMASPVLAGGGGGGAKKDSALKVTNDLTAANDPPYVVVVVDPPASLLAKLNAGTATVKEIKAAGGVTIKKGSSATIAVKSGDVPVYGTVVLANGAVPAGGITTLTFTKGKTLAVNASQF
jgi:hypothetical protein